MLLKLFKTIFWWLLKRDLLPDSILRWRVRKGLSEMVMDMKKATHEERVDNEDKFVKEIKTLPIATHQQEANDQHYELPPEFFKIVLGPKLKYSSCVYSSSSTTLTDAETEMLLLTCARAEVGPNMTVLDLGCGWGSLGLFVAEKFPTTQVFMLSNSYPQKKFIESVVGERGLKNVTVFTGDVAVYENEEFVKKFDRVMSIEMFEHMKNYEKLLEKISGWMKPTGKLFIHIFTHKWKSYHFDKDWMARTFFTGGCMPSHSLLLNFQERVLLERQWGVSGSHYAKTLDNWLDRMDNNNEVVEKILKETYGEKWRKWRLNWRLFFIVCSETFGYSDGTEWAVSHYLFKNRN